MELLVATILSAHPKAQLLLFGADDTRLSGHQETTLVVQEHSEGVLEAGGVHGALRAHESGHAVRLAEEVHGLVQQVGTQIVDGAAAGDDLVLPLGGIGSGLLRAVAVKVGFVFDDAAQRAVLDQLGEGNEVGVPAAVCMR